MSPSGDCPDVYVYVEDLETEIQALHAAGVALEGPAEMIDGLRKRAFIEIVDPKTMHLYRIGKLVDCRAIGSRERRIALTGSPHRALCPSTGL